MTYIQYSMVMAVFVVFCLGFSLVDSQGIDVQDASKLSNDGDITQGSQNAFYPSYSPFESQPLGHSRPFYFNNQQEGAYSQRSFPYQQLFNTPERYNGFKDDFVPVSSPSSDSLGILGSGNFGVIAGGTFYNDKDGQNSKYGDYDPFFHNGHGRPAHPFNGASNPKAYPREQFADFRDFADINNPTDRQYSQSQYVVVYANKNGTYQEKSDQQQAENIKYRPKNIMESLALLDLEPSTTTETALKKLSKSKRKLDLLLPEKKYLRKSLKKYNYAKDVNEPLLALS